MATATDSVPRQRNARGEGDRLRIDLLNAAADLLGEHGTVEGVSLRAVARRAGVSATAVYRHFADHHELVREAVAHCWQSFLEMLEEATRDATDPFDAFARSGFGYATFATTHQGQYRVMFSNHIEIEDETALIADATFQVLVDQVTAMLTELGDDRDPVFVAVQVHTWIHGIVGLMGCHPDSDWPSVAEQLDGLRHALGLVPPAEARTSTE